MQAVPRDEDVVLGAALAVGERRAERQCIKPRQWLAIRRRFAQPVVRPIARREQVGRGNASGLRAGLAAGEPVTAGRNR